MKHCTFARLLTTGCLCGLLLLLVGCNGSHRTVDTSTGEYRTISVTPLRDTDAAKRANDRGLSLLADGELDKAKDAFKDALTADVEYGPAHNNLGKVYYMQRDWYKAAWEFEYAKKQMPKHAGPHNNLGLVLEHAGELDKAVDEYRAAVSLAPDNMQYIGNLARTLVRRGDTRTDETRTLLKQIVENDKRIPWVIWARQELAGMGVEYE